MHKAIRTGRITPETDGSIDRERADREWNENTDEAKFGTRARVPRVPLSDTPANPDGTGGASLLQARTVNEVVKAQTNKVRLARLKGELVDRSQAIAHVFALARAERDAWLNWPARVSGQLAAALAADPHEVHVLLEAAVREHLQELGNIRPRVD